MLNLPSGHACVPERGASHTVKVVIVEAFVCRTPTKPVFLCQVSVKRRRGGRVAEVPIPEGFSCCYRLCKSHL